MITARGLRLSGVAQQAYLAVVLILLLLPLAALIPMSFSPTSTIVAFPDRWSPRWYAAVLGSPEWGAAFGWSLLIAGAASLAATTLGYVAATAMLRTGGWLGSLLRLLVLSPLMVPQIVVALATYLLVTSIGLTGSWVGIAIGQSLLALPVATLIIVASLRGISETIVQAAVSLGGNPWQVFWGVVLPMALHGILSAAALSFLVAFDELLVAVFLTTPTLQTLPVRVYQSVQYELTPVIAVVSVLLMAILCISLVFSQFYQFVRNRIIPAD
jgi:ABC-type spermidine/putrescine transport system permease subunit II